MAVHQARRKFIELHLEFSASHVILTAFTMMIYFNFFLELNLCNVKYNIVTGLLRALLSNGSVNKPQQRDWFLWGPRRDRCYARQR
jgi:hypothetical protein